MHSGTISLRVQVSSRHPLRAYDATMNPQERVLDIALVRRRRFGCRRIHEPLHPQFPWACHERMYCIDENKEFDQRCGIDRYFSATGIRHLEGKVRARAGQNGRAPPLLASDNGYTINVGRCDAKTHLWCPRKISQQSRPPCVGRGG